MQFRIAVLASVLAVGLVFSVLPATAAITHTTTNLNLRAGPGTHHRIKAIIPAGAPIDIESCGTLGAIWLGLDMWGTSNINT